MFSNEALVRRRRRGRTPVVDARLAQVFLSDVKTQAPGLLPIFRSRLQGELLARLLLGPVREFGLLDLARLVRGDLAGVAREVDRLARAGILLVRSAGRSGGRLVSRDVESPLFESLAALVLLTFGPAVVVEEEFGRIAGVRECHIFGTWAARYAGVEGGNPEAVDVLVVGDVERFALHQASETAESRLGLPVNPVVRTAAEWQLATDPFLREIRAETMVQILGSRQHSREEVVTKMSAPDR